MIKNSKYTALFILLISGSVWAQGDIGNEEITITKERKVELQKANRIFEKIPPTAKSTDEKKQQSYDFFEKKPEGIKEVDFTPNIVAPDQKKKGEEETKGYANYFKVGGGNYGRFYAETYLNTNQENKLVLGFHGLHNASKRGPVLGEISGSGIDLLNVDGKYHSGNFEMKANADYERRNYHFYGFDTTSYYNYTKDEVRQRLNIYKFGVAFENTNPKPAVDYKLSTNLRSLTDLYNAEELDWGTQFSSYFPIVANKVTAALSAESYLTQRTDNYETDPTRKRNLFRVEPFFSLDFKSINVHIGYKAVNQYDQNTQLNQTKGFPSVMLTYKTPRLIYYFAGIDGDIIRNTLGSFLDENPYLKPQVMLENTVKDQEYFLGSRGELFSGVQYNFKASYGTYSNLYFYNTYDGSLLPNPQTRLFEVYYNADKSQFANISAEVSYQTLEFWSTNLKADYYYYEPFTFDIGNQTVALDRPWHKPSFTTRIGNTFNVSDKIVSAIDFYMIGNTFAYNPNIYETVKIPAITDLNAEFTYLFSKQFSAFVKLNNIIGKNYVRYINYPQMGLNFLVGINVSL